MTSETQCRPSTRWLNDPFQTHLAMQSGAPVHRPVTRGSAHVEHLQQALAAAEAAQETNEATADSRQENIE